MVFGLAAASSFAAETVDIQVGATIQEAYQVTKVDDMTFGTIIPVVTGDTITLDASGVTATTASGSGAGAISAGDADTDVSAGDYNTGVIQITTSIDNVSFTPGYEDTNSGSTTAITLTRSGGTDELTLNVASIDSNSNESAVETAMASAGTYYFHLGGDLTIPANSPTGTYSGDMTVTLTF